MTYYVHLKVESGSGTCKYIANVLIKITHYSAKILPLYNTRQHYSTRNYKPYTVLHYSKVTDRRRSAYKAPCQQCPFQHMCINQRK